MLLLLSLFLFPSSCTLSLSRIKKMLLSTLRFMWYHIYKIVLVSWTILTLSWSYVFDRPEFTLFSIPIFMIIAYHAAEDAASKE